MKNIKKMSYHETQIFIFMGNNNILKLLKEKSYFWNNQNLPKKTELFSLFRK